MKKIKFLIEGMKCGGCVSKIQNKIDGMEGVKSCHVSLEEKMAVVEFDKTLNKAINFKTEIENLGFNVVEMQKVQ